jgi:hypothetical protein
MNGSWTVRLEDASHVVAAEISGWTGRLKISWDGRTVDVSTVLWPYGDIRAFERNGHSFVLSVRGVPSLGGYLALALDGVEVAAGAALSPAPTSLPYFQFVHEQNVVKTEEVVSVDDFPLDNTFGTDELVSEQQVSKESTSELTLETTSQLNGKLGLKLFSALEAEVSTLLSKKTGATVGQKTTETKTLRFTVKEGSSVVYQVIWKRKVRAGEYVYWAQGSHLTVPYRIHYGLSHQVRTLSG